ncbi:hypothetical protein [Roseovarius sp. D22-M7]|uniref:hypothetical protein n=1 Tax=Roseovarius sp. D22-M7 TaxID=3127116 RepID=UPI00300F90A5
MHILIGASGLSCVDAAETCHCDVGTIKRRLNRGCARLGELFDPAPDTPAAHRDPVQPMAGPVATSAGPE